MLSKDLIGLKFPVQLNGKGDLASVSGLDLEKADLMLLLSIEKGELPWDSEYGTRLRELLHEHVSSTVTSNAIAFREATDQINTYAPAYRAMTAGVSFEKNLASVSITYVERAKLEPERRTVRVEVPR